MATPPDFVSGAVLTAAQMNAVGLWKVTPSSVSGTGASIASNGDVVVTSGGSNFTVNGAFSTSYSNYKLIFRDFRVGGAASGIYLALGTSNTGTSHRYAGVYVSTAGVVAGEGNGGTTRFSTGIVGRSTTTSVAGEVMLFGPQKTEETTFTSHGVDSDTSAMGRMYSGIHIDDTAFTACFISTDTTQTFTAVTLSIYGFNG